MRSALRARTVASARVDFRKLGAGRGARKAMRHG
jgi:hypothetical protein